VESNITPIAGAVARRWRRAHLRETQEMVFDDNDRASPIMCAPQVTGLLGATYAQVVLENHEQAFCRM